MKTILILLFASSLLSVAQPVSRELPVRSARVAPTRPGNAEAQVAAAEEKLKVAKENIFDAAKSGNWDAVYAAEKAHTVALDALNAALIAREGLPPVEGERSTLQQRLALISSGQDFRETPRVPMTFVMEIASTRQKVEAAKQKYLEAVKSGNQEGISATEKKQKEATAALDTAIAAVETWRVANDKESVERQRLHAERAAGWKKSAEEQTALNEMLPLKYLGKTNDALGAWLRLQVDNRSTNAVAGFQGRCQLQNFFGETVLDAVISYDKTLPAQAKMDIIVPVENSVALVAASSEKIKMSLFSIHVVIFESGEKKTTPNPLHQTATRGVRSDPIDVQQ